MNKDKKNLALYMGLLSIAVILIAGVLKLTVIPMIIENTSVTFQGLAPVVGFIIFIHILNSLFANMSLSELAKITERYDFNLKSGLIIFKDLKLRDYFGETQETLGEDFETPGIIGIAPVITSILHFIAMIFLFYTILVEGLEYATDELFIALIAYVTFYNLHITARSLAIGSIIKEVGPMTYMTSYKKYFIVPLVTFIMILIFMVIPFLITRFMPFIDFSALPGYRIINIITIIFPMLGISGFVTFGIKSASSDIKSEYISEDQMNGRLDSFNNSYNFNNNETGFISNSYGDFMRGGQDDSGQFYD